jgi:hypothetical protein
MNRAIKWIRKNWWEFLVGTIVAGFIIEFLNANVYQIWVYKWPWNWFVIPFFNTSIITLTLGWLLLGLGSLVLTIFYEELRTDSNIQHAWIMGWVLMGFIYEFINSKIWNMWAYPQSGNIGAYTIPSIFGHFVIPFLDFSIFVPIIGYAGCGLISFWVIRYILRNLNLKSGKPVKL